MPQMTSQILKFVDFTKTQISRYLENKTLFAHQRLLYDKKSFSSRGKL